MTCIASRAEQRHTTGRHDNSRCRMIVLEASSTVLVSPAHPPPSSFEGGWNGADTKMVRATRYYIYNYCLRLTSSISGVTRKMGMSMVYHDWGSRSSKTACVRGPAQLTGGGDSRVLTVRQGTRSGGRCRGSRTTPVKPPPTSQRMIII